MLADQRADGFGVERVGIIDDPCAKNCRPAQRPGKSKRVEEGKDSQQPVMMIEAENLFHLGNVRSNVVMAEHNALRLTSATAGKNHSGQIIQADVLHAPAKPLQQSQRKEPSSQSSKNFFRKRRSR